MVQAFTQAFAVSGWVLTARLCVATSGSLRQTAGWLRVRLSTSSYVQACTSQALDAGFVWLLWLSPSALASWSHYLWLRLCVSSGSVSGVVSSVQLTCAHALDLCFSLVGIPPALTLTSSNGHPGYPVPAMITWWHSHSPHLAGVDRWWGEFL